MRDMGEQTSFEYLTFDRINDVYSPEDNIVLYPGDVENFLETIPDNSISLIITSPPYNLGKEYEQRVAIDEYLETHSRTIDQLHRVLKDSGSICWQVGNYVKDGEVFPLDIFYYRIFKEHFGELAQLDWMGRTKGAPVH